MPLLLPNGNQLDIPENVIGVTSDGYHSFNDLYAMRHALFLALCRGQGGGWKSLQQSDGSNLEGWFIAGVTLPDVGDITFHLPITYWGCQSTLHLRTLDRAPSWDGHTSSDVEQRLLMYASLEVV